jgi:hypothetical protein
MDKATKKLIQDTSLPEGSDALIKQKAEEASSKLKGLFNKE